MCFSKGTKPDVPILGILMHSRKGSEPKGRGCDLPSDREEGSVFQSGSLEGCVTEWSGQLVSLSGLGIKNRKVNLGSAQTGRACNTCGKPRGHPPVMP